MWSRFQALVQQHGERVAMTNESSQATYGSLLEGAEALGPLFEDVRQPVVMIALPSGPELTMVELAVFRAKGVALLVPDKVAEREARSMLELVTPDLVAVASLAEQAPLLRALGQPTTVLTFETGAHAYRGKHRIVRIGELDACRLVLPVRERRFPADARLLQFTSGSTGRPKALVFSNAALVANLEANRSHLATFAGRDVFSTLPQFHAMGGAIVMEHLWHGSSVHVTNRFVPATDLRRMQDYACAAIASSPVYLRLMYGLGVLCRDRLPELASFTIGTAGIEPALITDLHGAYPEAVIHCRYGLSESMGALTRLSLRADEPYQFGLVGELVGDAEYSTSMRAQPAVAQEIVVRSDRHASAELVADGTCVPLTDECGFLRTGDIGQFDVAGRLVIRGRASSFLKVSGHRISPFEIELALQSIAGVREAVVVGTPDALLGQRIVACIETLPGQSLPDATQLDRLCRNELAPHKVPQRFVVFSNLPRTHSGKPDRNAILMEVTR